GSCSAACTSFSCSLRETLPRADAARRPPSGSHRGYGASGAATARPRGDRRELRSFGFLAASSDYAAAQPQVTLLETELQQRTQRSLPALGAAPPFTVDRSARQDERGRTIASAPAGAVVLVHGEPDVGKSALALATVDSVRASGGAALVMSLRDLPRKAVDLKAALGLGPVDLLATAPSAPVSVLLLDGAEILQEGESGALTALLDAAASAGRTVVLVSRDDAAGSIRELLRERGAGDPVEFAVDPLSDDEIGAVVAAIPELARLLSDPRASRLLRLWGPEVCLACELLRCGLEVAT